MNDPNSPGAVPPLPPPLPPPPQSPAVAIDSTLELSVKRDSNPVYVLIRLPTVLKMIIFKQCEPEQLHRIKVFVQDNAKQIAETERNHVLEVLKTLWQELLTNHFGAPALNRLQNKFKENPLTFSDHDMPDTGRFDRLETYAGEFFRLEKLAQKKIPQEYWLLVRAMKYGYSAEHELTPSDFKDMEKFFAWHQGGAHCPDWWCQEPAASALLLPKDNQLVELMYHGDKPKPFQAIEYDPSQNNPLSLDYESPPEPPRTPQEGISDPSANNSESPDDASQEKKHARSQRVALTRSVILRQSVNIITEQFTAATLNLSQEDIGLLLLNAIKSFHIEAAQFFIEKNANCNLYDNTISPLHLAVRLGSIEMVSLLIQHKADVNTFIKSCSPLMVAAEEGYSDVVQVLIDNNANVDTFQVNASSTSKIATPLMIAAQRNYASVAKILIAAKANIDATQENNNGTQNNNSRPLAQAVSNNHVAVTQVLIDHNAEMDFVADDDDHHHRLFLLALAIKKGCLTTARVLIESGASVNLAPVPLTQPLVLAAERKDGAEIVQCLIDHKADINAKSFYFQTGNKTALEVTTAAGHADIVEFLTAASESTTQAPKPTTPAPPPTHESTRISAPPLPSPPSTTTLIQAPLLIQLPQQELTSSSSSTLTASTMQAPPAQEPASASTPLITPQVNRVAESKISSDPNDISKNYAIVGVMLVATVVAIIICALTAGQTTPLFIIAAAALVDGGGLLLLKRHGSAKSISSGMQRLFARMSCVPCMGSPSASMRL